MGSLIKCQHEDSTSDEGDISQLLLQPLLLGHVVALEVKDNRILPKKRVTRPVLFMTPGSLVGMDNLLIVSLWGHGCEVLDTSQPIKVQQLMMVGVGSKTARALSLALTKLYSGDIYDGNKITQKRPIEG